MHDPLPVVIQPLRVEDLEAFPIPGIRQQMAVLRMAKHWSITVMTKDMDIIACGGFVEKSPGYFIAWMFANTMIRKYKFEVQEAAREALRGFEEDWKPRRVEAMAPFDSVEGRRFIERCGFKMEAVMKKAHENGDLCLYARTA